MNSINTPSARILISASFRVGFVLGSLETLRVLLSIPRLNAFEIAALLFYGCIGHAIVSAALSLILIYGCALEGRAPSVVPSLAVAISTTAFTSIQFLSALAVTGQPQLGWLIPGCILMGTACGAAAYWLTLRLRLFQSSLVWNIVATFLLVLNLLFAVKKAEHSILLGYFGIVAGIFLVLIFSLLKWRRDQIRAKLFLAANTYLVLVIAFMPSAVAAWEGARSNSNRIDSRPNVILISVDTLRRDRLGCYGYTRAKTPHIDRLAREGVLFDDATTPVAVTGPAHTTMLTGLYPIHHGATANGIPMRRSVITVSEVLSKAGYRTAAFVSGWPLKHTPSALAEHFGYYDEDFALWRGFPDAVLYLALPQLISEAAHALGFRIDQLERTGSETTTRAVEWLSRNADRPFFLFVHYFDPHGPHLPLDESKFVRLAENGRLLFTYKTSLAAQQQILSSPANLEYIQSLYDQEISYTDLQIGRLTAALSSLQLEKNTLVIFTADHGESLTEHNYYFGHGEYLYETCIRVPLIIKSPQMFSSFSILREQVGLIDLAPTILDLLNINCTTRFDGKSLLPLIQRVDLRPRTSFGSVYSGRGIDSRSRHYVRKSSYKLIWNLDIREKFRDRPAYEELYDLKTDPAEMKNIIDKPLPLLEELRKELAEWIRQKPGVRIPENEEILDRLRALGYVGN